MKKLWYIFTILLLVSCNKEERKIYGKWENYESYTRSSENQPWELVDYFAKEIEITKNSWSIIPESAGKVTTYNGTVITENPIDVRIEYTYFKNIDELEIREYNKLNLNFIKIKLRR